MAKLWFGRGELLDLDVCVLLYAPRRRRLNLDTTSRIESRYDVKDRDLRWAYSLRTPKVPASEDLSLHAIKPRSSMKCHRSKNP